jgi:hypothetical protein
MWVEVAALALASIVALFVGKFLSSLKRFRELNLDGPRGVPVAGFGLEFLKGGSEGQFK